MGREILFRGKHIHLFPGNKHLDGVWAEGYLGDKNYIYSPESGDESLVDPETVCQYTGLTDRNGRKIFEGDIIRYRGKLFKIVWVPECAHFAAHPLEEISWSPCMNTGTVKDAETAGNIFDNPELLEGGAE